VVWATPRTGRNACATSGKAASSDAGQFVHIAYIEERFSSQKTLGEEAVLASLGMAAVKKKSEVRENDDGVGEADLWGEDVFGVGFDLDGGEAGGVPAAAEGFD
jgi:hypothetical protein